MPRNKLQGFEEVDSNGVLFVFRGNFGFVAAVKELTGKSVFSLVETIPEGDAGDVKDVLIASLVKRAGDNADDLTPDDKAEIIEQFITDHGFQECCILANHMLTNAMVGNLKKNKLDKHQNVQSLLNSLMISRSKIFKNHAVLWAYLAVIFGIYQCLSIKFLETPTF